MIKCAALFGVMAGAPTCTGDVPYNVFQCSGSLGSIAVELAAVII